MMPNEHDENESEYDENESEYETMRDGLKQDINEFLFAKVHGKMTIEEFDNLAMDIFGKICDAWEKAAERSE